MERTLNDFKIMGGKAIELTGGGEPSIYPYFKETFGKIIKYDFDYGLVTNGVVLTEELAKQIAPKMTWARISFDAATEKTYCRLRKAPKEHFRKAIRSLELLKKYAKNPQFKLGFGFVVSNENYKELLLACDLAKSHGADNIRISIVFIEERLGYFKPETIEEGSQIAGECSAFEDENFKVYNLFDERLKNIEIGRQDYRFCGTKELLCVIGGDCNVYTCCSLAFNKKGLIGNLKEQSFKELWDSEEKRKMFRDFDASKICSYMCLYETRNKYINSLLKKDPLHVNFI